MKPRRWISKTQTMCLSTLRHIRSIWDWKAIVIDQSLEWEGIPDHGYNVEPTRGQLDMFYHREAA